MQNLRNRINVRLVKNKKEYLKWISKPSYMLHIIFYNDLVAIRERKFTLKRNEPADIRMRILELSKVLMYKFHYDYFKNKHDNGSRLLFPESDSLMYEIKTEDVHEDCRIDKEMFEFSNSRKSRYYSFLNKLVIGKMKDETGGVAIEEFIGLKPKMYSFFIDDNSKHKKAKGVTRMNCC